MGHLRVCVHAERNLTHIVTVTPVPAWLYNVEGYSTQVRLTDTMGVRIAGAMEPGRIKLRVVAEKGCELLIYRPAEWKSLVVKMDDTSVPFREVEEAGQRFIVTPVALLGPHIIIVSQGG